MKIDKAYQQELLSKLAKSPDLKKEKQLLNQLFEQPIFWLVPPANTDEISPLPNSPECPLLKTPKNKQLLKCLKDTLERSKRSRRVEQFNCRAHYNGLCFPLVQGDALYGFLVLCHLKSKVSPESMHAYEALNSIMLEKAQKELELSKLYQTIRPRAVALSTVHTIHRLISSSLNLDELLPRIARLSLQVLRAKRCTISLVDHKTKRLGIKALIDLTKTKLKPRPSLVVKRIEKKVIRTGNILLKNSYLSVPLVDEEPIGVITISKKMSKKAFDAFDREILGALSEQAVGAIKNAQLYKEQENMLLGTVKSLSSLLKAKSPHAYTNSPEFVEIVLGIAKELKLSDEELRNLRFAAMLHDAEKISIPEQILQKPTHLTGKELKIIEEHPKKSVKLLSPLERLKPAVAIILHHHEKFNGTGYPDKLKGEQIPLGSRILAVADAFEAMISRRPYRKTTPIAEAIKELKRQNGTQFDPQVINAFLKFTKKQSFKKILKGK